MQKRIMSVVAASAVVALYCLGAAPASPDAAVPIPPAATQPAPVPSTQPAGFSIRGRVTVPAGFGFQKPDLTRVVVYLASDPALDAAPHTLAHATVAQHMKAFVPNFAVIPRGTDVEFPNWDNFNHNVFSFSKAAPAFDLDRYPRGQSKTRNFDKVGVVQVFCNIHPQMHALIVVTPNIYFTRAGAEGRFQLDGVPAGHYTMVSWQERCEEQRQEIDIHAGEMPELVFNLEESRKNSLANDPPKHGSDYGVDRGLGIKRERLQLPVVKDSHPALDPEK